MKKVFVLLAVFPVLLALSACGLAIPKAVEVRTAPDIDIDVEIDLSQTIKDELKSAINSQITVQKVKGIAFAKNQDENMVLVAYLEVLEVGQQGLFNAINGISVMFNGSFKTISQILQDSGMEGTVHAGNVESILGNPLLQIALNTVIANTPEISNPDKMEIYLGSLGEILSDFIFTGSQGELYVFDDARKVDLSTRLDFKYSVNGGQLQTGVPKRAPSKYAQYWNRDDLQFPDDAPKDIDVTILGDLFDQQNKLSASFSVSVKSGVTIRQLLECVKDAEIKAEIIAWIPLTFRANTNNAFFKIPIEEMLGEGDDLFRRKKDQAVNVEVTEMSIELKFTVEAFNRMFNDKRMQVTNTFNPAGFNKTYDLVRNNFVIEFSPADMMLINNDINIPFTPSIKILFGYNQNLNIPYELKTENVKLSAKALVRAEL
jgi:predicted small lipoprotein YifL